MYLATMKCEEALEKKVKAISIHSSVVAFETNVNALPAE